MKILVTMPLNETSEYYSSAIFQGLSEKLQEITLPMPLFMDYLKTTNVARDNFDAIFYGLKGALNIAHQQGEDLIVLGNIDKSISFDFIFALTDEGEIIHDFNMEEVQKKVANIDELKKLVYNIYTDEDASLFVSVQDLDGAAKLIEKFYNISKKEEEKMKELNKKVKDIGERISKNTIQ